MARGIANHLYKHGLFSGWEDYRYGSDAASRVTVAPIFNTARRESLSGRIAFEIADYDSSPFEMEGPLRHGIRSSLCLQGHDWTRANAEAASLVDMALDKNQAVRPTKEEGQPDHSGMYDYCSWCACPIDEATRTRGQRFCTVECGKAAMIYRERDSGFHKGLVIRSARRMIAREKAPVRTCQQCGNSFRSENEDATFCSHRCVTDSLRVLVEITCEACGKVTMPVNKGQRFCSLMCRSSVVAHEQKARLADEVRQCAECGKDFTPRSSSSRHCSTRCGAKERNRLYKARGGQAAAHTYTCRCCGVGFTSKQQRATPYCSKPCRDIVERFEGGQGKRLTSRVFDYMLRRDHVPMTGEHITDHLFA